MKKRMLLLILSVLCAVCFVSCGYNGVMYKHLSNIDNYESCNATVNQIFFENEYNGRLVKYTKGIHDGSYFKGKTVFIDILPEGSKRSVRVEIIPQNSQILFDNGFFDIIEENITITIQASVWTYMDSEFNFVIGLGYDGIQYLNSEDGLDNIIKMMDADRSFF